MKNYRDSDYALNKYSKSIVYRFADSVAEVTMEGYLRENPDKTVDDFYELKAVSDAMYLEQDREEYQQTWKNTPYESLSETDIFSVSTLEDYIIENPERIVKKIQRREIGFGVFERLTEVQQRRYRMYHVEHLTMRQIAEIEGTKHQSIVECLAAAEKKINKFLKNS